MEGKFGSWVEDGKNLLCGKNGDSLYYFTEVEMKMKKLPNGTGLRAFVPFHGMLTLHDDFNLKLNIVSEGDRQVTLKPFRSIGFLCVLCGLVARDRKKLEEHREMHRGPQLCDLCSENFVDKQKLYVHHKMCYKPCPYDGCETVFLYQQIKKITRHMYKHLCSLT